MSARPSKSPGTTSTVELHLTIKRDGKTLRVDVDYPERGLKADPFHFKPPLKPADLDELRWYLEYYWRWPVGPDVERATRLERRLRGLGDALFKSVFSDSEAMRLWEQFRDRTDCARILTIDGAPEAMRLPWELIADEEGHVFSLDISLRRRVHKTQAAPQAPSELPVRILMVVARPQDERTAFIDPCASPRALLDAVEPLGAENVIVEFLHPPTVQALDKRLRARNQPRVHVVHFDGHGVYSMKESLGYLAFEDDKGGLDLVDAERLGTLMAGATVPLVLLDACQSAHAEAPDPFTSVAPRLIRAGVHSVVAMQYSVLVETSRRFFAALYRALAEGASVGQAVDEGRRDLLSNTKRFTLYKPDEGEVDIELRDWFLPALYQQTTDTAPAKGAVLRPAEGAAAPSRLHGEFHDPPYGFTGRARELWELGRLLRKRRIVVLHGFGGEGKTALASEAARWLTRTGAFERAIFLSFEAGGEAEWAVTQMGRLLRGDDFSALSPADQLATLKQALGEHSTLIVWDNLESVLPGWQAELPAEALEELLGLGADLAGSGPTRLLITTRDPDLPYPAYVPSRRMARLPLGGLIPSEALAFAGEVLDTLGHERPERPDLERLLDYLGGHPLSIQLTMPHLQEFDNNVETVIARFDKLYSGFTEGKARERHESLDVSLAFSLDRLSKATRERLLSLGVFEGGASEVQILQVTGLKPSEWREIRAELERAGLLTPEEEMPFGIDTEEGRFGGRYLRFHPTLAPYLRGLLPAEERRSLEERYRRAYYALSGHLYKADSQNPHAVRAVARWELPNLSRALDLTVAAGELEMVAAFADSVDLFLSVFGRQRERGTLMERIGDAFKTPGTAAGGPLTKAEFILESRRGELLLDQGRLVEAERLFRRLLARIEAGTDYTADQSGYDRSITLHRLGRSLVGQGRAREAEAEYRHGLEALSGLDQEHPDVRRETGYIHADLGDTLRAQGRYGEARGCYERSLEIAEGIGDPRSAAVAFGQLGTLALVQRDYAEARRRHREALVRFRALGEPRMEAVIWHQLGVVAQEETRSAEGDRRAALLTESEAAYRESLHLEEAIGDKAGAAQTANQLAIIARMAGRPADAERWYRRALEQHAATGSQSRFSLVANNLAFLLLNMERLSAAEQPPEFSGRDLLAEAEEWAEKAREIKEALSDPSTEVWTTYGILADIAETRGDGERARTWRRKERAAYAAFPGHWAREQERWKPRIEVIKAAAQGVAQTQEAVQEFLQGLAQTADWRNLAAALQEVMAGERDADALADGHNLDRADYLILLKVLEAVKG
jgi:tetratricopeptide (TPR) repeat protein